jgi:hypothetical protein
MDAFEEILESWIGKIKGKYVFFGDDRVLLQFKAIALKAYDQSIPSYEKIDKLIREKYSMDSEVLDDWIYFYKECLNERFIHETGYFLNTFAT